MVLSFIPMPVSMTFPWMCALEYREQTVSHPMNEADTVQQGDMGILGGLSEDSRVVSVRPPYQPTKNRSVKWARKGEEQRKT
jgi:hypothetical protein